MAWMSLKNIIYNKLAGRKINSSRKLIYYINFNFQYLNLLSRLLLIIIGIHFSFHLNFFYLCVCVCVCVCVFVSRFSPNILSLTEKGFSGLSMTISNSWKTWGIKAIEIDLTSWDTSVQSRISTLVCCSHWVDSI